MIKLSNRLAAIASLVPLNSNVIDIGCDHALLDIYLYQNKISNHIIASDINENALNNAILNIKKEKLDNVIETRLGSGLDTLKDSDHIDTIVISGMGTYTIIEILNNNKSKIDNIENIIVQSNNKLPLLRKEISILNYFIENEIIIEDNKKIYTIIKFQKGKKHYSRKELYFGPILLKEKNATFIKYNTRELSKLKYHLKVLPKNRLIDKFKIKQEIRLYKRVL